MIYVNAVLINLVFLPNSTKDKGASLKLEPGELEMLCSESNDSGLNQVNDTISNARKTRARRENRDETRTYDRFQCAIDP